MAVRVFGAAGRAVRHARDAVIHFIVVVALVLARAAERRHRYGGDHEPHHPRGTHSSHETPNTAPHHPAMMQEARPGVQARRTLPELLTDLLREGLRAFAVGAFVLDDLANEPRLGFLRKTGCLHFGRERRALERRGPGGFDGGGGLSSGDVVRGL